MSAPADRQITGTGKEVVPDPSGTQKLLDIAQTTQAARRGAIPPGTTAVAGHQPLRDFGSSCTEMVPGRCNAGPSFSASRTGPKAMPINVEVGRSLGSASSVRYMWDAETGILGVDLASGLRASQSADAGQSLHLLGPDGAWVHLELEGGRLSTVEVAVWPRLRRLPSVSPPDVAKYSDVRLSTQGRRGRPALINEFDMSIVAEACESTRSLRFRFGAHAERNVVRLAREMYIGIDARNNLAGIWLTDVPGLPS